MHIKRRRVAEPRVVGRETDDLGAVSHALVGELLVNRVKANKAAKLYTARIHYLTSLSRIHVVRAEHEICKRRNERFYKRTHRNVFAERNEMSL